jgi:hypothetical protein
MAEKEITETPSNHEGLTERASAQLTADRIEAVFAATKRLELQDLAHLGTLRQDLRDQITRLEALPMEGPLSLQKADDRRARLDRLDALLELLKVSMRTTEAIIPEAEGGDK